MGQNRIEIYAEVLRKIGLPDTDKRVTTDEVYPAINNGLRKLSRDYDWPWLVTQTTLSLTTGATTAPVPDDFQRALWIADLSAGYELRNSQRRAMIRWGSLNGYPKYFSVQGTLINFAPTTPRNQNYTLAYIAKEPLLLDDSDETLCPDDQMDIVYVYAAIEVATALKDATLRASLIDELKDIRSTMKTAARLSRPLPSIRTRTIWGRG